MKTKNSRLKIVALAGAALALCAALLAGVRYAGASGPETSWTKTVVGLKDDSVTIEASGNIEAARSGNLSFSSVGLVDAVYVREGDGVAKGQALAALDAGEESYSYQETIYRLDQYRLTGNARQAQLAALELDMRKDRLDRTRIVAPFSGVITEVSVEEGEYVSSGEVAVSLIDRSSLVATLQIDEIDIPLVSLGQTVSFVFDALPGKSYEGYVEKIPPVGTITSQGLAVFKVQATIPNPPAELLPGFSFTASVKVSQADPVLTIPASALAQGAPNASSRLHGDSRDSLKLSCYVPDSSGQPVLKSFTGTLRSDGTVQVISGLSLGDTVLDRKSVV